MHILRTFGAGAIGFALLAATACSDADHAANSPASTNSADGNASLTANRTPAARTATAVRSGDTMSTAELVEHVEPSVVRIETATGVGSGFVVGEEGYILTNFHVIEAATGRAASDITVTLSDGAEFQASVAGSDPRADIALLQIDATGLPALEFADLDEVNIGDDVVAMGFALDLEGGEGGSFSVTRGIISQKNRAIDEGSFAIFGAVQTDAAINHGNSGGPLLDLYGRVVGVNTAIAPDPTTGETAPGIGFAVGSDTARAIFEQLRDHGQVARGYLGIQGFQALRPAEARARGIGQDEGGVIIRTVVPGNPAADAGLQDDDVIVKIGETDVDDEADLATALIANQAGETVPLEYYRGSSLERTTITLGAAPTN